MPGPLALNPRSTLCPWLCQPVQHLSSCSINEGGSAVWGQGIAQHIPGLGLSPYHQKEIRVQEDNGEEFGLVWGLPRAQDY